MPLRLVLGLIVFQILLIFVHIDVYVLLSAAFGIGNIWLAIIFVLLAVFFIVMSAVVHWSKNRVNQWLYTASAYWFGLVHFLFVGGVGFFLASLVLYNLNIYIAPWILGVLFFGVLFLIHLYGTWCAWRAEITKISVVLPHMPSSWRGKKIVFMSDLHLGAIHHVGFAAKVVRKIQALSPEAVFIGGDLYDGVQCDPAGLIEPLRSLHTPYGTYFITGNHEYYLPNLPEALEAIRKVGIRILNDEKVNIQGIQVIGLDYHTTAKKDALEAVLKEIAVDPEAPSIVLKHEPNHLEVLERKDFSLGLFGHTHQGQIYPLSLITKKIYKGFDYGLKKLGALQVYTSSGAGTWGPPLRLGTRSEIVLIEFK